ncbi:MAG: hypothetical protein ACOYOK_02845 [Pseudobdellovibrionaceae bacterium]
MQTTGPLLQNHLKTFGLNPIDWRIINIKKNTYKIKNKKDPQFVLYGYTGEQKDSWAYLKVLSI